MLSSASKVALENSSFFIGVVNDGVFVSCRLCPGMKAYIDKDDNIRLFRPDMNLKRFQNSSKRLFLPVPDEQELLAALKELLKIEKRWIPKGKGYSLYIRPTHISTHSFIGVAKAQASLVYVILSPVGPYYASGFAPVRLLAEPKYVRAWPGGTGDTKVGGNYAMGIKPGDEAINRGFAQMLWVFGDDLQVTEVGTMNIFFLWEKKDGSGKELVTAALDGAQFEWVQVPACVTTFLSFSSSFCCVCVFFCALTGTILPGVTRDSIIQLAKMWGDFEVSETHYTLHDVIDAVEEGRMVEAFGAGTAAIVSPVEGFQYKGKDYAIPLNPDKPEDMAGAFTKVYNERRESVGFLPQVFKLSHLMIILRNVSSAYCGHFDGHSIWRDRGP